MRDKIVIVVEPPSPSQKLDIEDAFKQVLDFLRLVELAASDDANFEWKLEGASTNSPFTVTAYTPRQAGDDNRTESLPVAQRRAEEGLTELASGRVPGWMRKKQRSTARRITQRFKTNIGRMRLRPDEQTKISFSVNRSMAARALNTLEKVDGFEDIQVPSHRAYGELEGTLVGAGTYYGKPALWVRVQGHDLVRCQIDEQRLRALGDAATVAEIWEHKRVRIVGRLSYEEGGTLGSVSVDELELFPGSDVQLADIVDPGFTGGMSPIEYLDRLNNGELH